MKKPSASWVIVDATTNEAVCTRCQVRAKIPLPMDLSKFVLWCDGFTMMHENCKAPAS